MLTCFWREQSRLERKSFPRSRTKPMVGFANLKIRLGIPCFSARHLHHNASTGRAFFGRFCVARPLLQVGEVVLGPTSPASVTCLFSYQCKKKYWYRLS